MSLESTALAALRDLALALPGVSEGVSCEGTALEKRAFQVRGKAFLHAGPQRGQIVALLKLGPGIEAARALEAGSSGRVKVGKGGWVTLTLPPDDPLSPQIAGWVAESHGLFAGAR